MTDKASPWVSQQKALAPDKPFFVYFAPGATHAPHHVPRVGRWEDKQKSDEGWDKLRGNQIVRQKALGVILRMHSRLRAMRRSPVGAKCGRLS